MKITRSGTRWLAFFTTIIVLASCSSALMRDEQYTSSSHLPAPRSSALLNDLHSEMLQHPLQTGTLPLIDGGNAFAARLNLIDRATQSIDLQYYIYRTDETGNMMTWALLKAAERGVRVRMLLDDTTTKHVDPNIVALEHHPNVEIRLYNSMLLHKFPALSWLFNFSHLNYRMHNKSLTVDNSASVIGGRNIGDEYFAADDQFGFGDFDVLTVGNAVPEISVQFDQYWQSPLAIPLEQDLARGLTDKKFEDESDKLQALQLHFQDAPYYKKTISNPLYTSMHHPDLRWYWGDAILVYDLPNKAEEKKQAMLITKITAEFKKAQKRILIISPYFVPTTKGAKGLIELKTRGVDVTVITNSLAATDVVAVHSGYRAYRKKLLKAGINLYEVKADPTVHMPSWGVSSRTSLHAKTFVIDDDTLFVGSFNFDPRSAWINTEMGLIMKQPEFVTDIEHYVKAVLPGGAYRLTLDDGDIYWHDDEDNKIYTEEPKADFSRKLNADFISIFPVESQL